jgi:Na+/H+ antiporter NhaA
MMLGVTHIPAEEGVFVLSLAVSDFLDALLTTALVYTNDCY